MILEARHREALREVLIVASALSVQDVRDRPLEQQQAADQAHAKFDDDKSEFLGTLKLWSWLEHSRGGHGEHRLSSRKHEQLLRDNFISPRRVREWRDIHAQLQSVVSEHGWRVNASEPTYEQLHQSMLAGLLGNIGVKSDEDESYLGARGIRFWRHPGARPGEEAGRWIVAAELVETTRLYARGIAAIDAALAAAARRPPHQDAAARAALGEEGGAGDRARARDALRHRRLRQQAGRLRDVDPARRARSSSARRSSPASGRRSCRSRRPTAS
jgi:HrpA-like RNA helicase